MMEENKMEMEIQEAIPAEEILDIPAEGSTLSVGKVLGAMVVIGLVGYGTVKLIKHLKNKKDEIEEITLEELTDDVRTKTEIQNGDSKEN